MSGNQINEEALKLHKKLKGKLKIELATEINDDNIKLVYSPGVAAPCVEIAKDESKVYDYTIKGHTIGIFTNGTAVLGLGDIGAKASIPVMEGKAALLKKYVNIDAFPICIDEKDPDKFVEIAKKISSVFGAVNLEDISSPNCVYIENKLQKESDIPFFHDDQHGTAIAALAGLINIEKIKGRDIKNDKVVVCGVGAAGSAIIKSLNSYGFNNIYAVDRQGSLISDDRKTNPVFKELIENKLIKTTTKRQSLEETLKDANIFIGVSKADLMTKEMIATMQKDPVIFALANPKPELSREVAEALKIRFYASGAHAKFNQINNFLVFPGVLRGLLETRKNITHELKALVAKAVANIVTDKELKQNIFIPKASNKKLHDDVTQTIRDYFNV